MIKLFFKNNCYYIFILKMHWLQLFGLIWVWQLKRFPPPALDLVQLPSARRLVVFFRLPAQWRLYSSLEIRHFFKACELTKGENSCSFYPLLSPPNLPPPTVISLPVLFGRSCRTPRDQQLYTHHPQLTIQKNKALAWFTHTNYGDITWNNKLWLLPLGSTYANLQCVTLKRRRFLQRESSVFPLERCRC